MTETASTLDEMIGSECRHGFVSDLECDSVPRGLSEGTVRMISKKKGSVARGHALKHTLVTIY